MACKPMDDKTREKLNHLWDEGAPTPPEPSAEAVKAVARGLSQEMGGYLGEAEYDLARAALAADPLRRELGDKIRHMRQCANDARHRAAASDDDRTDWLMVADREDLRADELAALLEKHA